MTETEKAIRDFCGHHADWWPSISQVKKIQSIAQLEPFKPDWDTQAVLVEEQQRMARRIEDLEAKRESAYQRGYLDGIGRDCPHCKDYKAMYIKVRDELAAEQQITQRQTARIVDLQTHIENLEGEDR